jgi:transcriptional regulator with XRE-family HTH domain
MLCTRRRVTRGAMTDEEDPKLRVGRLIRELRNRLKLTQEVVAERAGEPWTRPSVAKIERGDNQLSTLDARRRLARGLGVDVTRLSRYIEGEIGIDDVVPAPSHGRTYEPGEDRGLPSTSIGQHADYPRTVEDLKRLLGDRVSQTVLGWLPTASAGQMPERLTVVYLLRVYEAIEESERQRDAEQKPR